MINYSDINQFLPSLLMNLSQSFRALLRLEKILIIFSLLIIHNNVANSATLINAAGGSTVHLREYLGDVQYSFDNNTWNTVSFPIRLTSTDAGDVDLNFASGSFAPTSIDYIINNILSGNRLNISYTSGGLPIQNNTGYIIDSFSNSANLNFTDVNVLDNYGGVVDSINNTGTMSSNDESGIANGSGGTIAAITNSGTISGSDAIYNIGTITNLINSGTISNTGRVGIYNWGIVTTLTNAAGGVISGSGGLGAIFNDPTASLVTFNNAQGGDSSTASKTALVYNTKLPTNYNIIITSPTNYGQLAWTNQNSGGAAGLTNFGIYNSSVITSRLYTGVLQGLADGNVGATRTGSYDGMSWTLAISSGTSWDLTFSGVSLTQTQSSLTTLSKNLRSSFNATLMSSNFANMNTYDCNLFDKNNMCISAGGRVTTIDNPSSHHSAAVVVLGYKVSPHIRIGGFLDQSVNHNMPSGVDMSNKNPMMGAFLVWNHQADGLGFQMKLANAYLDKDVTTLREVIGTSEAGRGRTDLNTQSYVGELSYAFNYQEQTIVRPYFALRYTRIKQDGYTEETSASVTAPLTYATLSDRSTTALMGVRVNHALTPKTNLTASLGVEQDLDHKVDQLSATGVSGLTSENFNNNIRHTRPVASLGAYYAVAKNQRLSGDIYYQQLPFQNTDSATAFVNYMIGF